MLTPTAKADFQGGRSIKFKFTLKNLEKLHILQLHMS